MKTIIAGSRSIDNYKELCNLIKESDFIITEVISGGAKGVDKLGERYAIEHNINLNIMNAQWQLYGRSAGYIRNQQMSSYADALILLWDGVSKGSLNMLNIATKDKLFIYSKILSS